MRFGGYGFHSIGAPTIANYAFSVELALKVIHAISSGVEARGHDLESLYGSLPEDIRSNLPNLGGCVSDISRDFEKWRYAHEHEFLMASESDSRRSFIECYQEIWRLCPELSSIYERLWGSFEPNWFHAWTEGEASEAKDIYIH
jgi:HEPN domain-containing protein